RRAQGKLRAVCARLVPGDRARPSSVGILLGDHSGARKRLRRAQPDGLPKRAAGRGARSRDAGGPGWAQGAGRAGPGFDRRRSALHSLVARELPGRPLCAPAGIRAISPRLSAAFGQGTRGRAVRRLAGTPLAIAGSLLLVSLFLDLVPGDPVELMLGEQAPSIDRQALRHAVGLDRPWYAQLWLFLGQMATGQLRSSLPPFQRKVLPQIWAALPNTLLLTLAAIVVAVLIAVPLGVAAASRKGSAVDHGAMAVAVAGVAVPRFWLGPMLIILFAIKLDWLPVSGAESVRHLVLPAITLGTALAAFLSRVTR